MRSVSAKNRDRQIYGRRLLWGIVLSQEDLANSAASRNGPHPSRRTISVASLCSGLCWARSRRIFSPQSGECPAARIFIAETAVKKDARRSRENADVLDSFFGMQLDRCAPLGPGPLRTGTALR